MDPTKWRIAKACQECRARKIRCDGADPCQRCQTRHVPCVYRKKARNRVRKSVQLPAANPLPTGPTKIDPDSVLRDTAGTDIDASSRGGGRGSIHNHSVSATHRASPSVFLQLYYGPSSNFSLLNSIYHQIEGTRPVTDGSREVEEMGPGLDLFNSRRLYFGDLTDGSEASRAISDTSALFLDRSLAERLMDRYLNTYWHILPIWSKAEFRNKLAGLYNSSELFTSENPDTTIVVLAMAIGATMLEEEIPAQYLYRKAKQWSAMLDDMVNIQTVQIALLMISHTPNPDSVFHCV